MIQSIFDTKKMSKLRFTILFLLLASTQMAFAQKNKEEKADKAIKTVINRFFEGMEKGDTALLRSTCMPNPVFQTYMAEKGGKLVVYTQDFNEFVTFVGTPSQKKYKEVIQFGSISSEKSLASVWTPYKFYLDDKLSHCGTNSFQLVKTDEGWKIQYIIDTRRKNCD